MLTRYDLLLGKAIEGLFELGQRELHPIELDAKLRTVALEQREAHEERQVAPNRYFVELPAPRFEEMAALWPLVSEELALSLEEYSRAQGFGFLGPVKVEIRAGSDGRIRVIGQFTER
jgi:hypothetical protein